MTLIEGDDEPTSPPMFTGNVQQCLIGLTLLVPLTLLQYKVC